MPTASESSICLGREAELAALREQLAKTLDGSPGICVVHGGAGVGKSTLLRAFTGSLSEQETEPVVAWGHCDSQTGRLRPLLPWAEILESLAGVREVSVPEERVRDQRGVLRSVRSTVTELAPDIIELLIPGFGLAVRSARLISRRAPILRRLAGRRHDQDGKALEADRVELADQYIAILENVLNVSPLILVIDDLHCADDASLNLLDRLVTRVRDRPLLIVIATQGARNPDTPLARMIGQLNATEVDLDRAIGEHGRRFVEAYASATAPGLGAGFIDELAEQTGGHPLFVVELLAHLVRQGALVEKNGTWDVGGPIDWAELPSRVEQLLDSELRALDPEVREVLQAASVEGEQFTAEVVAGVLEQTPVPVVRLLTRRAPTNLVEPLGHIPLAGTRVSRFRFRHSLSHRHAYLSVSDVERPYYHEAVCREYERLGHDAPDAVAAQLAHHYDLALLPDRARVWYERAGTHARATFAIQEAATHFDRALDRCPDRSVDQVRLLMALGEVRTPVGDLAEATELFARAAELAESLAPELLAQALVNQSRGLTRLSRFEEAEACADRAAKLAQADGDARGQAEALDARAFAATRRGNNPESLAYAEQALTLARPLADEELLAHLLLRHGWSLKELGRFDEATGSLTESLDVQRRAGANLATYAGTHNALADLQISLENYPAARSHLNEAIETWRRFDQNSDVAVGLNNLANLANREGLFELALDYGRQALAMDEALLGVGHAEVAFALTCLGESYLGLGDSAAAIGVLQRANALRTEHEVPAGNRAWTRWLLGRCLVESAVDGELGMKLIQEARTVFAFMGEAAASETRDVEAWLATQQES